MTFEDRSNKRLNEVRDLLAGDRNQTHGDFMQGMDATGRIQNILEALPGFENMPPAARAANRQRVVKLVREYNGQPNEDDPRDSIGYSLVSWEASTEQASDMDQFRRERDQMIRDWHANEWLPSRERLHKK